MSSKDLETKDDESLVVDEVMKKEVVLNDEDESVSPEKDEGDRKKIDDDDVVVQAPPLISTMTRDLNMLVDKKEEEEEEDIELKEEVKREPEVKNEDTSTKEEERKITASPITDTEIGTEEEVEDEDEPVMVNMNRAAECVIMAATKLWLDDSLSNVCMNASCSSEFTFLNRRAHCRLCGLIFCKPCVSKTRVLPASYRYGENAVKVCTPCATLVDRQKSSLLSPKRMLERRRRVFRHADLTKEESSSSSTSTVLALQNNIDADNEEMAVHRQVYRVIGPKRLETNCYSCLRPFSRITLRRHHCRRCGRAVCSECSDKKHTLKSHNYGEEEVRHCDECYERSKNNETSRLCLNGNSKLPFKCLVVRDVERKHFEVRTYLMHENFCVNVKRTRYDFYWLHKSLLSEHPKQRLPLLLFDNDQCLARYLNTILTHELIVSKASSVCIFLSLSLSMYLPPNIINHKTQVRAFLGLTSRNAFEVFTGKSIVASIQEEEDNDENNKRIVETLADLSELSRIDRWLTFAIAQQRFRERTENYKTRRDMIQDRLAKASTRRERHEERAKQSTARFESFKKRRKIAESILSPCPARLQRENDRLLKQKSKPTLVFIQRVEDNKSRKEAETRLNNLKIEHMKTRQELDSDQNMFSEDQKSFLDSKKKIATEVASDDWENEEFYGLASKVRETFENKSSRRQRLEHLFQVSEQEFKVLQVEIEKERESVDSEFRIFEKEAHILARDDTECDEEELILRNTCEALEEEHDVIKQERIVRKEKETNVLKDLVHRETILSEMRTQRDQAEKDVRHRVEDVSKRKEEEINVISTLESGMKYVTRVLKKMERRCGLLESCTKLQSESKYVLRFVEVEEDEEEEEEESRWEVRYERFQDKERMLLLDRAIENGTSSSKSNLEKCNELRKRLEKDRELLKQGNSRTEHESEVYHKSDQFCENVLSRRVRIDRELKEDVELMVTHQDSLEILRKSANEQNDRVERITKLKVEISKLFERTSVASKNMRVANVAFLEAKRSVRDGLETPLNTSLLNSEVREREYVSRKLNREKRRSRRRNSFALPLDRISRDLGEKFVLQSKTTKKPDGAIDLNMIVKNRKVVSERFTIFSRDHSKLRSIENEIKKLSQNLQDRAKDMDIDLEAREMDLGELEKDLNAVMNTWGQYPGRRKGCKEKENHDTKFVENMESKFKKLNASHKAERESLRSELGDLNEEKEEWSSVRDRIREITTRLEKLNRKYEIERGELEKEVTYWTNRGEEMMETLRFEMGEMREMMVLIKDSSRGVDGEVCCEDSVGHENDVAYEDNAGHEEEKEEDLEEEEEEKCVDVEIMI